MQPVLQKSTFVRYHKIDNSFVVYHSLFAKPLFVNKDVIKIIELFETPKCISELQFHIDKKIIETLRERLFLVEVGFSERTLLNNIHDAYIEQVAMGKTLIQLGLAVSDSCNLACPHCIHFKQHKRENSLMSWEIAKQAIDTFMNFTGNQGKANVKIHFGRAEPLLNWKLIEKVISYCTSKYRHIKTAFSINTNLILLTKDQALVLRKYNVVIGTSLDGGKKANDSNRILPSGSGTYDIIVRNLRMLRDINYPVTSVNATITEANFDLLDDDMVMAAKELGLKEISFDIDSINDIHLQNDIIINKFFDFKKKCQKNGIKAGGIWMTPYLNMINRDILNDELYSFCKSIRGTSITVSPNGDLFICPHSKIKMGHMKSFCELFDKKSSFIRVISSRLPGRNVICHDCEIEGQCAGQCQATCEFTDYGLKAKYNSMCQFYIKATKELLADKLRAEFQ